MPAGPGRRPAAGAGWRRAEMAERNVKQTNKALMPDVRGVKRRPKAAMRNLAPVNHVLKYYSSLKM